MLNTRLERNRAMRKAYAFARSGNAIWTKLWLDRANAFLHVPYRTVQRLQAVLDAAPMHSTNQISRQVTDAAVAARLHAIAQEQD
jgi:hypothetical protein